MTMTNSCCLIVGGAPGIGQLCVEAFHHGGRPTVVIDDVHRPDLPEAVVQITGELADPDLPRQAIATALERFSGIDAVIVTPSAMHGQPIADWTAADWDRADAINVRLPFLLAQAAAPALRQCGNGSIVFLSSTAARRGQPLTHAYQATKAGLESLVRSLAAELGPDGVRVNAVLAGWIDTPFNNRYWQGLDDPEGARRAFDATIPLRRHGTAGEVVSVIRFLTSPDSSYVTGTCIVVDGGATAV